MAQMATSNRMYPIDTDIKIIVLVIDENHADEQ
jgi:hypothetical protein